jgi:hypothetical protein
MRGNRGEGMQEVSLLLADTADMACPLTQVSAGITFRRKGIRLMAPGWAIAEKNTSRRTPYGKRSHGSH